MPVKWRSRNGRRGRVATSLTGATATVAGTSATASSHLGRISGLVYDFTSAIAGTFQSSAQRNAVISTTLAGCTAGLRGTVNYPVSWVDGLGDSFTITAGQAFSKTFIAYDPDGDIIDIIQQSLSPGLTAVETDQEGFYKTITISSPTTLAAGTYTAVLDLTESTDEPAEQDWQLRSNYDGVVWAHDFRAPEEVNYFLSNLPEGETPTTVQTEDGITGGAMTLNLLGNAKIDIARLEYLPGTAYGVNAVRVTFSAPPPVAEPIDLTDYLRFFGLTGSWAILNDTKNGGGGTIYRYKIFNIVSPTVYDIQTQVEPVMLRNFAVDASGFAAVDNPAGGLVQRCRVSRGSWHRPLSCFSGAYNGIGADDRGISLGEPARTWNINLPYAPHSTKFNRHRTDFYGNSAYQSYLDTWPEYNAGSTPSAGGKYRGGEFWLQLRVKISAGRYQDANSQPNSNSDYKMFGMWSTIGTPSHEIFIQDMNTPQGSDLGPETAADGGIIKGYTNQSDAKTFEKQTGGFWQQQPGGEYGLTCHTDAGGDWPTDITDCWHFPPDEWVTFLLHVIAGEEEGNGTYYPSTDPRKVSITQLWPNPIDPAKATGIQLWACKQSEIDAAQVAGRAPVYTKIYDCVGANGFPFAFNNGLIHTFFGQEQFREDGVTPNPEYRNYNNSAPGWNAVWLTTYQNNVPILYGFTRKYCQVIFKKGNMTPGQTTFAPDVDGIPCPRY
jgi:hypothetical protein